MNKCVNATLCNVVFLERVQNLHMQGLQAIQKRFESYVKRLY